MTPFAPRAIAGIPALVGALSFSLALLAGHLSALASSHDVTAGAGLSYGADSNPLELPADAESGAYTQADFGFSIVPSAGRRVGLLASGDGLRRWHEAPAADADEGWADLRGGISVVPYVNGSRRLTMAAGGAYGASRATFIDPATGEVYEHVGTSISTAIPDRLDHEASGVFMDLKYQAGRNLLVYVDAESGRRNYAEDYREADGLHSLDDRSTSVEPGLRARLWRVLVLDLSWSRTLRRYDEMPALEDGAVEVPGVRREYRYSRYQVTAKVAPGGGWEIVAGVRATDRSDLHVGFYDTIGTSSLLSVGWAPAKGTRLRLATTRSSVGYPNAPVGSNPNGETRESDVRRLVAHVEHGLRGGLSIYLHAGREESRDRDPDYVYDKRWAHAGVRMEFGK